MTALANPAQQARMDLRDEEAREERWIKVYTEITGASEALARACWMFATVAEDQRPIVAPVTLDGTPQPFA